MDKKVARALRASRRQYQDGGFTSDTEQDQMRAASDPHRYERFVEPVAKGVQWLKDMVKAPFDMARDAREAGGYSNLDPTEVGRAGLNTGLGALAPAAGLATGALPKGSGFVLSSGGAPSEPKGIRAYHGSPHDFDKFDLSKIGTGEGAQAYGHGLYFAQSEDVARSYRDALTTKPADVVGSFIESKVKYGDKIVSPPTARYLAEQGYPSDAETAGLVDRIIRGGQRASDGSVTYSTDAMAAFRDLENRLKPPGRMYEVRIDADPNDFLDWDKPLSQQPKAQAALRSLKLPPEAIDDLGGDLTILRNAERPQDAYDTLSSLSGVGDVRGASQALREAGIPGIKYLDQGSRTMSQQVKSAQDGLEYWKKVGDPDKIAQAERVLQRMIEMDQHASRNYVLFRDDIIQIVRKYGMAAAVSMYGADAVTNAMAAQNDY